MRRIPENGLPLRVGISSCLLGERVRYDGGHKQDHYLMDILAQFFEFVPVCPEMEAGMSVPREPVRLQGDPESPRMIGTKTGADWTERLNEFARRRTRQLTGMHLSGYILKKGSPSCGLERVKVYGEQGMPARKGRGLFAAALLERLPILPVEEEGRLNDIGNRENFITRVFAYHRLQDLFRGRWSRGRVVAFHAAHKYLLLAHSAELYRQLGRLVANVKDYLPGEFRDRYSELFMQALNRRATVKKNVNVLHHLLGFLKQSLTVRDKQALLSVIEDYRQEIVPLIVPLTLVKHYLAQEGNEFSRNQVYLNPHPRELKLRNHA
ncbi:MAG: DUF523 and DUF1722 domain-containing protein [bacterium]